MTKKNNFFFEKLFLVGEKSENVPIPDAVNKRLSRDSESNLVCSYFLFQINANHYRTGESTRVTTPTAIESQLPWKRDDEDDDNGGALKQNEFPAWASNKEYLAYNSPSATFLGKIFLLILDFCFQNFN